MDDLKVDTLAFANGCYTIRIPKPVARISICGVVCLNIDDTMAFIKPTSEQIKNLKETFCIDVELFEEKEEE